MPVGIVDEVGHRRGTGAPDRVVAVARRVVLGQKPVEQGHIRQKAARGGWQRLADPRGRTYSTLDQQHTPGRRQIQRRHRPRGASA